MMVILLLLTAVWGCEKDFVISQQTDAKKMVINCLFNDNGPLTVYLTNSYLASAYGNINSINDAKMELYEDNVLKEVIKYFPSDSINTFGAYKSLLTPQKGRNYMIKVTDPAYGTASASDAIPRAVTINSSQLIEYGDTTVNNHDVILDLKIQDDAAVQNYYRVNIFIGGIRWYLDVNKDTVTENYFEARGPEMLTPVDDTVRDGVFLLFSDRNFNGQVKDMTMKFENLDSANYTSLGIYVALFTASATDYQYQQTLAAYRNSKGSISSEPVHVYNNIQNGYGIFAAEQFQALQFIIK